jgi:hypothetical protein
MHARSRLKSRPRLPMIGRYANAFRVGFNAFELIIEFGEQFTDNDDDEHLHTRIVTNPVAARALLTALQQALDQRGAALLNAAPAVPATPSNNDPDASMT